MSVKYLSGNPGEISQGYSVRYLSAIAQRSIPVGHLVQDLNVSFVSDFSNIFKY